MLPGPTTIRQCNECNRPFLERTISSGNTFGATLWTDGRMYAPMLPDQKWLVKCPNCSALLWLDEQHRVGELGDQRTAKSDGRLRHFRSPSSRDYARLLSRETSALQKERYIRTRLWWAWNDGRRRFFRGAPLKRAARDNLIRLAQLMDESVGSDRLAKAEIMRELARFSEARALIAGIDDPLLTDTAEFIGGLIGRSDSRIHTIPSPRASGTGRSGPDRGGD